MPAGERYVYRIDQDAVVIRISQSWLAFARENWDPRFTAKFVLGTSLWTHIGGSATRQIYNLIMERLKSGLKGLSFGFRCDSPALRRFMHLEIISLPLGDVEFAANIVREEPREPQALLEPDRTASQQWVTMCSWCKRIKTPAWALPFSSGLAEDAWEEVETLMTPFSLADAGHLPEVSHGVCPDCQLRVMQALDAGEY